MGLFLAVTVFFVHSLTTLFPPRNGSTNFEKETYDFMDSNTKIDRYYSNSKNNNLRAKPSDPLPVATSLSSSSSDESEMPETPFSEEEGEDDDEITYGSESLSETNYSEEEEDDDDVGGGDDDDDTYGSESLSETNYSEEEEEKEM